MNDKGREVLIKAGLEGVRQIRGTYTDQKGGYCGLGVLMKEIRSILVPRSQLLQAYDLTYEEMDQIVELNDAGVDFIGIARKMEVTP